MPPTVVRRYLVLRTMYCNYNIITKTWFFKTKHLATGQARLVTATQIILKILQVVDCLAPLSELLGYSTTLRSLSSGLASFTMEFHSYQQMSAYDEEKAIRSVTGF